MATEPVTKSTNAKLMALKISSGKSLVPVFHQETTSYTYNVNNEISSITITPTRVIWFKSTITVNGVSVNSAAQSQPIELNVGGNVINVVVTAEDEVTTNTYTIYVIREQANLREYVVTVHNFDDIESLYADLENSGTGQHNALPNRAVECQLRRPVSRNTHYWLTDEEARTVAADPRVLAVELTIEELGFTAGPAGSWTQTSSQWSKSASLSQGDLNWGLYRVFNGAQVSNWGFDGTQNVSGTVNLPLSGSNVDVVIVDGMLDPAHPEFAVNANGTGGSRVSQYNWYSLNPTVTGGGTASYSYLLDTADQDYKHGHHVAGITAGNTQGWARDANIYNISPQYVAGGVTYSYLFDYIKVWHQNKSVNVSTGVKNPTICNNSWLLYYSTAYTNVTSVTYRGTTTTKSFTKSELNAYGIYVDASNNALIPARSAAVDADIADLIAAGVIVVGCAGNYYTKIDVPGGVDYNNLMVVSGSTTVYTNRGSSPGSATGVICVGSTGAGITSGGDRKASYSNCGPRVDIWAPGTYINSSWVGTAGGAGMANPVTDTRNSSYYTGKLSGTSMASPQVAGVLACLLEKFPGLNQTTARTITTSTSVFATSGQIPATTGGPTDYFDLQGAPNTHLTWRTLTPSASASASGLSIDEGSNVTISVDTTNLGASTLYWTTDRTASDFVSNINTGSFSVSNVGLSGSGSFTISLSADNLTEGLETFTVSIRTTSTTGAVVATAGPININDISTTPAPASTYSFGSIPTSINEGSAGTFNVTTTDVSNGTTLYWTIASNSSDFSTTSGSFTVNSNAGSFTVTPTADLTTEGSETFTVAIRTGSVSGTIVATSNSVNINDSSTTPAPTVYTYTISPNKTSVVEGEPITYSVVTTNVSNNTRLFWTNSGTTISSDFVNNVDSGSIVINQNAASFVVRLASDIVTELTETVIVKLRTASTSGPIVSTATTVVVGNVPPKVVEWNTSLGFLGTITAMTDVLISLVKN